ncbi:16S rRNA (guanine(527)-N(7))-methyltransferase RsmG [Tenacibaculum maritimum]|uniref:16S rRNA (guanine(527)-N(7))-methyltransferase RsmG n=1 Tax=Tenacibaculum maritimum TaxID=107401 RepID=UPI0012E5E5D5|nr:16S rRNA (guanine(527)-N(7))-methyltransferase RsmG [Tenacibaculum maritimum]MCD9562577.1 16S rRNA (guanine(527)-N(7))-methyltransferase RsmG [Tenacibaculum maritimum]MCD9566005.1 16S rRNA (guanine(527)-N(7))-methyltransferase RsmG [Tenacibaculum maritimum]MCD9577748.1 16S rRNA (guanine(527)-N(7))-methyltransferase RsmG [Tenacibaculum maritimum]MCD9596695.1 16S rRNA (guanine(527)-N(7))-methyltransferase RsmG [Tenacibaculum maritimum]MCD9613529.1 16S rRNA (guanine(527)-N(7))-methyltransferas
MDILLKYFDGLSEVQLAQFSKLKELYKDWNLKINVVSRKDIDELYLRHVLHSLGIAKVMQFKAGTKVMDVGTGGGFPGIPLAILFPETDFHLVDSIGKKIKVVNEVAEGLGLKNVRTTHGRVEEVKDTYDFIVSRAVAQMETFERWVKNKVHKKQQHDLKNGILYLKGGDLVEELQHFPKATIYNLSDFFKEEFFETKKVVHLPMKYRG